VVKNLFNNGPLLNVKGAVVSARSAIAKGT
jgi:hypothetical protein